MGAHSSASHSNEGYRPAYTPGSQGQEANSAFGRQAGSSQYSRYSSAYSTRRSRKRSRGKKIVIGVLVAILVAVVGCGTAAALWINSVNDTLTRGDKSDTEIQNIKDQLTPTSSNFDKPFYLMLIGTDETEDSEEAQHRSDTNIVVRVDPTKNQATLVSIPRDTKIDIDGYGTNKFNAAYSYDGAAGAIREANQLLNVQISHYAEVNFGKLKSLVDAVGGVDVDVPELVDDPDADGSTAHPEWGRVIIQPGMQHLDGNQALVFARSRAYVDGDFTRTANQRALIKAIIDKVLAMPPTQLPGVVQSAAQSVTTDLSVNDILSLIKQFQDDGSLTMYSAMVPSSTATIDGVAYVINDADSTKKMMQIVEEGGDPSGITASDAARAAAAALDGSSSGGTGSGGSGYSSGSSGSSASSGTYDSGASYGSGGGSGYYDSGYYDASAASGSGGAATGGSATGGSGTGSGSAGSSAGVGSSAGTGSSAGIGGSSTGGSSAGGTGAGATGGAGAGTGSGY